MNSEIIAHYNTHSKSVSTDEYLVELCKRSFKLPVSIEELKQFLNRATFKEEMFDIVVSTTDKTMRFSKGAVLSALYALLGPTKMDFRKGDFEIKKFIVTQYCGILKLLEHAGCDVEVNDMDYFLLEKGDFEEMFSNK